MRFTERLTGLKRWVYKELCEGRVMKAPAEDMDIGKIKYQEPTCYLAWAPSKVDKMGNVQELPLSTIPGILIMPNQAYAKYMEEKRFDRYNNIHRPQGMGQNLSVSILFSVYEPGVRLPGFVDSVGEKGKGLDPNLILDGTEQGLFTVFNWMDDCMTKLLGQRVIPDTDLFVQDESVTYSLYTDQNYVVDRRPLYYGFVNVSFFCHANEAVNPEIEKLL